MRHLLRRALPAVVPPLACVLIGALRATLRIDYVDWRRVAHLDLPGRPVVVAFWHERLLLMPYAYPSWRRITVLISRHGDGELIARTMELFGHDTTRGSTTRGATSALREVVRKMRGGTDAAFTPDGPRGPRRKAQPGAVLAARLTGAPIVPVGVAASPRWLLRSWDRFLVPRPFGRAAVVYGEPIHVPRDGDEDSIETRRRQLERALNEVTDRADRLLGEEPPRSAGAGTREAAR